VSEPARRPAPTRERLERNPFYVLGLAAGASRATIEEEAQKLFGMLELGLRGAREYLTPFGPRLRTADDVRTALAELRDPARRLQHELWAGLDPAALATAAEPADGWPDAFAALGVGPEARGGR
jgi:hypothetical protein